MADSCYKEFHDMLFCAVAPARILQGTWPNGGSLAMIQQKTCEEFADKLCLHSIDNRLLHSAVQVCPIMTLSLCI